MRVWLSAKLNYIQSFAWSIMKHGGGCMVRVKLNAGQSWKKNLFYALKDLRVEERRIRFEQDSTLKHMVRVSWNCSNWSTEWPSQRPDIISNENLWKDLKIAELWLNWEHFGKKNLLLAKMPTLCCSFKLNPQKYSVLMVTSNTILIHLLRNDYLESRVEYVHQSPAMFVFSGFMQRLGLTELALGPGHGPLPAGPLRKRWGRTTNKKRKMCRKTWSEGENSWDETSQHWKTN